MEREETCEEDSCVSPHGSSGRAAGVSVPLPFTPLIFVTSPTLPPSVASPNYPTSSLMFHYS